MRDSPNPSAAPFRRRRRAARRSTSREANCNSGFDPRVSPTTIDSWLTWNLSRGEVHVTDPSNASRTLLFDIHKGAWDDELLALFDIPRSVLPRIVPSSGVCGHAKVGGIAIPIAGIAGDQQAALFGQACHSPGLAKNTYGTGGFLLMNSGHHAVASANNLLTTVAWQRDDATDYALEGSVFIGGAVVQWLRGGLGFIEKSGDVEALAAGAPDAGGGDLVPPVTGLGSPHWDAYARGTMDRAVARHDPGVHRARGARGDRVPERRGADGQAARLILYALSEKPCTVNELVNSLGIGQPAVSRHLNILRKHGLVVSARDGQSVVNKLNDVRVIEALNLLRLVLKDSLINQVSLVEQI